MDLVGFAKRLQLGARELDEAALLQIHVEQHRHAAQNTSFSIIPFIASVSDSGARDRLRIRDKDIACQSGLDGSCKATQTLNPQNKLSTCRWVRTSGGSPVPEFGLEIEMGMGLKSRESDVGNQEFRLKRPNHQASQRWTSASRRGPRAHLHPPGQRAPFRIRDSE